MKGIIKKYNPMINLLKFTYNKKIGLQSLHFVNNFQKTNFKSNYIAAHIDFLKQIEFCFSKKKKQIEFCDQLKLNQVENASNMLKKQLEDKL